LLFFNPLIYWLLKNFLPADLLRLGMRRCPKGG